MSFMQNRGTVSRFANRTPLGTDPVTPGRVPGALKPIQRPSGSRYGGSTDPAQPPGAPQPDPGFGFPTNPDGTVNWYEFWKSRQNRRALRPMSAHSTRPVGGYSQLADLLEMLQSQGGGGSMGAGGGYGGY